jgi:hypothetical protein
MDGLMLNLVPAFVVRPGLQARERPNAPRALRQRISETRVVAEKECRRQEMTLEQLLRGRSLLRCQCGKELIVEETKSADGHAVARFIPCQCGRRDPIHIEAGSVAAGGTSALMFVWGPPKDPCGSSG